MSDRRKEAEEKMTKAIFISADCWLCVFDLLSPRKLGLRIAMISHRFDHYVDEHFKTRKWALKFIRIRRKIGEYGTMKMRIVNLDENEMPIPQIQLPRKVIGFKWINIFFIDRNAIALLHRFGPLFAASQINLSITTNNDRILEFILRNIWPMIAKNIHGIHLPFGFFRRLRQFVPSILNDCPSLHVVFCDLGEFFPEFPTNDNAAASDGQSVAKWLFTPLQSDVPKLLKCMLDMNDGNWSSRIEDLQTAFASSSSPVNFIIVTWLLSPFAASVVPFDLTNKLTREQLALKRINDSHHFLLIRCPIVRDADKWTKWEEEAIRWQFRDQWNKIEIDLYDEEDVGKGLLDAMPGLSDQKK
ncbi:hypothetical protein niasHT_005500 [Heterodera trifolii]|uniref:F-box domain-containing protein n=1 Tax=Heterodera trifolii TaxID=157864 RepID=A0ABD2LST9_9BILA